MKNISISKIGYVSFLALALFVGTQVTYGAWTAPTAAAPDGNAPAPLNVSGAAQTKLGGLVIGTGNPTNGLIVQGGRVGLGTTNPSTKLDVIGNIQSQGLTIKSTDPLFNAASITLDAGTSPGSKYSLSADEGYEGKFTLRDVNANAARLIINPDGGVDVPGSFAVRDTLWSINSFVFLGKTTGLSSLLWMRAASENGGGIIIDTFNTNNGTALGANPTKSTNAYLWLNPYGGDTDEAGNTGSANPGKVAIGFTGAPQFTLDVAGTIRAQSQLRADKGITALESINLWSDGGPSVNHAFLQVDHIDSGFRLATGASPATGLNTDFTLQPGGQLKLSPNNGLYIPSGAAAGRVLTSNASGLATWQAAPASDARLKTNVAPIKSALDKVKKLSGVTFNWKEGGEKSIGLIAQEVEKVVPEVVHDEDNGYKSVEYDKLVGLLIEAIKEQDAKIDALTKQVEALKAR